MLKNEKIQFIQQLEKKLLNKYNNEQMTDNIRKMLFNITQYFQKGTIYKMMQQDI